MRRFWKKGAVLSLRLPDNTYTVAQMVDDKCTMTFFNLFRGKDDWQGVDLNSEQKIFTLSTLHVVKFLGERRIKKNEITPLEDMSFPQESIVPYFNEIENFHAGEFDLKGGRLSSYDKESNSEVVITKYLNVDDNREDILNYEFDTLASPKEVETRLLFYKTHQEDFSYFKHKIFPGLYSEALISKYEKLAKEFDIRF